MNSYIEFVSARNISPDPTLHTDAALLGCLNVLTIVSQHLGKYIEADGGRWEYEDEFLQIVLREDSSTEVHVIEKSLSSDDLWHTQVFSAEPGGKNSRVSEYASWGFVVCTFLLPKALEARAAAA